MFLHLAKKAGVAEKYEVDSAGTGSWHIGDSPDARMRRVAAAHGLEYDGRSRQIRPADFDYFDLFLVMDGENFEDMLALTQNPEQQRKIHRLREFDPQGDDLAGVPDPYYGGIQGFEEVYVMIERSVKGLLQALEDDPEKWF
jgi:protein-tyrosine phosphatase